MKPQQYHQPVTGRQIFLKQFPPINRQYQPQPNFKRQLFQFQPYQIFQPKNVSWQDRQFYRFFGYQNNFYNSNFQNR